MSKLAIGGGESKFYTNFAVVGIVANFGLFVSSVFVFWCFFV
jgi:hypothetical protein